MGDKKFVSIDELCQILGVSRAWIYQRTGPKARRVPRIPSQPWFGCLKFDLAEVNDVLNANSRNLSNLRSLKIENSEKNSLLLTSKNRKKEMLW